MQADLNTLIADCAGALYGAMAAARARSSESSPTPPPLLQLRSGFAESPGWFLVQAAEFDPEPLTVSNLRVRDVYGAERIVQALLELMAGERWLERRADAFHFAREGRALLQRIRQRQRAQLGELQPLSDHETARLAALLQRVIDASLVCPSPPGSWCLAHSRRRAPDREASPLLRIAQFFDDFNAFRDDAHMAAWQPLGVSGQTWEAFALVYNGEASTATEVFERLIHRGYSQGDHATALEDLTRHGWLEPVGSDSAYRLTETGRSVREGAEARTDGYFYAPWSCLLEEEALETHTLLTRLRDRLTELGN